jgi:hypothetical protein
MYTSGDWQLSKTDVFWGEVASDEHVVQLYDNEEAFLDMLAGFAGSGFKAGDSVVLIATASHLEELGNRLKAHGIHVDSLIANNQYIPLEAEQTLSKIMVDNRPDETSFMQVIGETVKRARKNNRKIRAFGEMVAILWARDEHAATIELEQLWNKFCSQESLTLFCAFPRSVFNDSPYDSIPHICSCHSKIIDNSPRAMIEVRYKPTGVVATGVNPNGVIATAV